MLHMRQEGPRLHVGSPLADVEWDCGRRATKHTCLLAQGTIVEKTDRHDITINNPHPYGVRYWFDLPSDATQTGGALVTDLKFAAKLHTGKNVGVIYLPAEPDRNTTSGDIRPATFSPL